LPLHFTAAEFAARRARAVAAMQADGLDGLLMFRQESMYYLTGYDTFGFVFFQCLYQSADGKTRTLLTRAPDLRQAQLTSDIEDIRIWRDRDGANPADELRAILEAHGCKGKRLGVEYDAYGLTAANGKRLEAALSGFCTLTDASMLVTRLRLVKSPAEITCVRRAAVLADDAYDAAVALAKPGAFDGEISAAMHAAILRGDGDEPANEFIVGSGPVALLCRYASGRRHLSANDQLTLEWAGTFRHYHAAMMRTLVIGKPPARQEYLHMAALDALSACEEALKPGNTVSAVFDAHARVCDAAGLKDARMNACGYSLGATFAPNWMDWPMLYAGNRVVLAPGMVFFMHMILFDSDVGVAATVARTYLVTDGGNEPLSRSEFRLQVG
jgi:Xaa-Pro dipeptidase